jgi:hypothetical protein
MKQSTTDASGRDSDMSFKEPDAGNHIGREDGLLAHFMTRMKFINFEMKNRETNLALRGPHADSFAKMQTSVTSSVALGRAHERIQEQKRDNILNLLDSVLRRN